jgi:hypothetical protein
MCRQVRKAKRNRLKNLLIIGTGAFFISLITGWSFGWLHNHEKIHPALPAHSFYLFTLTESGARIPCLQAEVEGISFLAQLDMGFAGVLSLPKDLLEQLTHKSDAGTVLFTGIRGKKYETQVFTIPELHIGDLTLVNLPAEESNVEFEWDTNLKTPIKPKSSDLKARIGWQAFLGTVVLIDLHKSVAVCCDSIKTLQEKGYPTSQFVSIDLAEEQLVGFEAGIGNRKVKCIVDTGCTLNLIRSRSGPSDAFTEQTESGCIDFDNPLPPTTLSIAGHYLGPCTFHEAHLPILIDAEAILGVNFLETQIVCIDFIHNKLFLCPVPEEDSLNLQADFAAAK